MQIFAKFAIFAKIAIFAIFAIFFFWSVKTVAVMGLGLKGRDRESFSLARKNSRVKHILLLARRHWLTGSLLGFLAFPA